MDARKLVQQIKVDLKPLEELITHHPYLDPLDQGRIERAALKTFAGHQFHIVRSDLRSIAVLLARHGHLPSMPYLKNLLDGESAAFEALLKFAQALGMRQDALDSFEPLPGAYAYCSFVAWLAAYGSDAELAAAFTVNFAAWGANCARMSKALKERYGLQPGDVRFFDLFANAPVESDAPFAVIQGGLDRGLAPALIHRAARMLQGYELMFWDAIAEAAGVEITRPR